jgi:hypothetical protein
MTPKNPSSTKGPEKHDETGGTSEETSLTVTLLGHDWVVTNGIGKSIGSASDRESAITLAKKAASSEHASSISVMAADGSREKTVTV